MPSIPLDESKTSPCFFLPSLTGLRFVAAFSILLAHATDQSFSPFGVKGLSLFAGGLAFFGMSLFFTLSGCVLMLNYGHYFETGKPFWPALRRFGIARFARIVPLYLAVGFVFLAATPINLSLLSKFPLYLTLTQSWWGVDKHGVDLFMHFMPHSWSISTEWFFYVAFPVTCLLVGGLQSLKSTTIGTLLTLLIFFGVMVTFRMAVNEGVFGVENKAAWLKWFTYFSPYSRLCEFILGCFCGSYILHRKGRSIPLWIARVLASFSILALIAVGLFASPFIGAAETSWLGYLSPSLLQAPFVACIVFVAALNGQVFGKILESKSFILGGECSYSLYLFHPLFTVHFANPVGNFGAVWWWLDPLLRFSTMVGLSLLIAYGGYNLIETPTRRYFRKFINKNESVSSRLTGLKT